MAEQNLDFVIAAQVQQTGDIARLIRQVGALEAEIKRVAAANGTLARSTEGVVRSGVRYNNALDAQSKAMRNARQGTQQLGMQINDFATSVSTGASPIQAFNQQIGQAGYAMSMMGGTAGRVGAFLMGPWGAAITFAVMGLGMLIEALWDTEDAMDELSANQLPAVTREIQLYQIQNAELPDLLQRASQFIRAQTLDYREQAAAIREVLSGKLALARAAEREALTNVSRQSTLSYAMPGWLASATGIGDADAAMQRWREAKTIADGIEAIYEGLANPVDPEARRSQSRASSSRTREMSAEEQAMSALRATAQQLNAAYDSGAISLAEYRTGVAALQREVDRTGRAFEDPLRRLEQYNRELENMAEYRREIRRSLATAFYDSSTEMDNNIILPDSMVAAAEANVQRATAIMRGYTDEMKDSFDAVGASVNDAFKGMVTGAMGWKSAMRSIIQSVIDQLWKLYVTQQITGFISSALGSFNMSVPARAIGGTVNSNSPYVVGEKGPELFIPRGNGTIIPNKNMGMGGGQSLVVNVDARGSTDPAMVDQRVRQGIIEAAPAIIAASQQGAIRSISRPRLGGAVG